MFSLDPRIRGIPAHRDQVLSLYQSINQPYVAIPGKQAGPAQAFIVGLRSQAGLNALVYLYLNESNDCAVYTSSVRNVDSDQYSGLEAEALGFVESMGFMMDNMNFTGVASSEQDEMMKTMPVFLKDPSSIRPPSTPPPSSSAAAASSAPTGAAKTTVATTLGKIFSSF